MRYRSSVRLSLLPALGISATLAIPEAYGQVLEEVLVTARKREENLQEVAVDDGIDQAIAGYRQFLEEAPASSLTPEAMRRLADLKLEAKAG